MAEAQDNREVVEYISGLVARARKAQGEIEFATQEEVDLMCTRVAWAGVRPDFAKPYTEFCAQETGMGHAPHKFAKQMTKVKGALRDMKGRKSVGIVEIDKEKGIMKLAKPVGVVGALMPVTNGEATPFCKALFAIKTRNAIIMAPHPKAQKTNDQAMAQIRGVLKKHGWPEDLVIGIERLAHRSRLEPELALPGGNRTGLGHLLPDPLVSQNPRRIPERVGALVFLVAASHVHVERPVHPFDHFALVRRIVIQ